MLISKSLICEREYQPFVDFGDMPIANAFAKKGELNDEYTSPTNQKADAILSANGIWHIPI